MSITFDSKAFSNTQSGIEKEHDKEARQRVNTHLANVLGYVKPLTPVGVYKDTRGGRLRSGWTVQTARKVKNSWTGYMINNVEYAAHVEYGHRTRYGTGRATPKTGSKKYVEGVKMLEKAIIKAKRKEGMV